MNSSFHLVDARFLRSLLLLAGLASIRAAAERGPWELTASVSARARYDSNLFLQDDAPTVGSVAPALPARAEATAAQVSASLAAGWRGSGGLSATVAYAPELWRYSRFASENHTDHRVSGAFTVVRSAWRADANTSLLVVDGTREAPVFNRVGATPAIGGEAVRSRRAQSLMKGAAQLTRDLGATSFLRLAAAGTAQDFYTRQGTTPTGCANYVDRGEASAGADLGWRVAPKLALTLGERHGRQRQADLLGVALSGTNAFDRWLFGLEGALTPTIKVAVAAGPDVRRFGSHARAGLDRTRTERFFEGSASWMPRPADTLTFSAKQYLWLSSGGRGAYVDGLFDLAWKHTLKKTWIVGTSANFHEGDAHAYGSGARHDRITTLTGSLNWSAASRLRVELGVTREIATSEISATPGRAYQRWQTSLGVTRPL